MENVVILGTGVAGCTAAIYAARANLAPILFSGEQDGGQLTLTTDVENFPGFPDGITGPKLVEACKKQAEKFGAKFKYDIATGFEEIESGFEVSFISGEKVQCQTLIIATGASARWLGIPSEEKYKGPISKTEFLANCIPPRYAKDGSYTLAFKKKMVALALKGTRSVVRSKFNIPETTLRRWIQEYQRRN